ncbi:DNA polymerase III subunit chi [Pseudogemmobacter faecipullorum]|uniref:DNA polymerase III subunit chi n=1 Tax=Pseudogemmobacter faecipullorum TaxID=2755041 RepID=A0ABS8CL22_9RHOB|nr:DNA polymerase III subunit chi [Pseudogemmobacter faecipullorum]MCB5410094.1 DNA polymerase III subunit chi [Pseudogemmobacter faecipullorum]
MGAVKFYHLQQNSLGDVARTLLGQALSQGWNVMLRGASRQRLERLDLALWQGPEDSFLPHGLEGGPHDADQPVLLGTGAAVNGARAVMLLAGSPVDPGEAGRMERIWLLFEDGDEDQMQIARAEWRAVTKAGLAAEYWSDETGRWVKKAESQPAA